MMSKIHFAFVERGNESNPNDDWGTTACGMEYTESPLSDRWEFVDCKRCLNKKWVFEGLNKHQNTHSHF